MDSMLGKAVRKHRIEAGRSAQRSREKRTWRKEAELTGGK